MLMNTVLRLLAIPLLWQLQRRRVTMIYGHVPWCEMHFFPCMNRIIKTLRYCYVRPCKSLFEVIHHWSLVSGLQPFRRKPMPGSEIWRHVRKRLMQLKKCMACVEEEMVAGSVLMESAYQSSAVPALFASSSQTSRYQHSTKRYLSIQIQPDAEGWCLVRWLKLHSSN